MKISNSKQQLAKIIHENGGWIDTACFAAQDHNAVVTFFVDKPWRCDAVWECENFEAVGGFGVTDSALKNWHQTILSRDEYFHLYPAPDADGWIKYCGTERPLGVFAEIIDVRLYDGRVITDFAGRFEWNADGNARIVAYRLSKQEQAKSTAVGDDETNLAAKEELEALEFEPSAPIIEQLAADYHAKLAIAQQAQEEADSHRCGAEAALEKLYQAGLAIGLDIAIADSEPEDNRKPELVITDWRDLQVGDEIEYLGGTTDSWIGKKGVVQLIDDDKSNLKILFRCGEEGESGNPRDWPSTIWLSDFKFIRRP